MTFTQLESLITSIIDKTIKLRDAYILEDLGTADYVAIFPQDEKEQQDLTQLLKLSSAKNVFTDNSGIVYKLHNSIQANEYHISLVKICNPDSLKAKRGYVDFQTNEYSRLKEKYINRKNFMTLNGDGWELIGIEDPASDVALYIPNVPLSKDLGLSQ